MKQLTELYDNSIGFIEYIANGNEEDEQKHLYYLNKMKFTEDEIEKVLAIQRSKTLLVFSDLFCPDCRITLAILENIKEVNSCVTYGIISREGHHELMKQWSGDHRIPLILDITEAEPKIIYNEYPELLRKKMSHSTEEEKKDILLQYRKGLFKKEMIQQLVTELQKGSEQND